MSPPLWVDEHGRRAADAPLPAVPARDSSEPLAGEDAGDHERWPYQVMTFVEWCGHQQDVVLVPEGDGWYSEIPVLGERAVMHSDSQTLSGRRVFEDLPNDRLELPRSPESPARAAVRARPAAAARRSVIAASSGCPTGLGSRSVTVFAICSGVGAARRAGAFARERRLAFVGAELTAGSGHTRGWHK